MGPNYLCTYGSFCRTLDTNQGLRLFEGKQSVRQKKKGRENREEVRKKENMGFLYISPRRINIFFM